MTRPPLLVPALALAALLVAAPAAASPAAEPNAPIVSADFKLAASNGLHAHVEAFNVGAGVVVLEIAARGGRSATYGVLEGEITEAGLKAQFGTLGLIEVAFTSTRTLETIKPAKGCKGEPSTSREGLFIGTIEFTGEQEYVRVEATQAKGTMEVDRGSEWQCPPWRELLMRPPGPSARSSRRQSKAKKGWATLVAKSRRCGCNFGGVAFRNRKGRGLTIFSAGKEEEREGMKIVRQDEAAAHPSAFVFDHAAGTARVHPPWPFSGTGFFKRRPHRRDLWRSTIQVPLLGADPLSIRGRDFRVRLTPGFPGSGE